MNINSINNVFLIGIGGIGMSALAQYFRQKGAQVSGYDLTPSKVTDMLQEKGIKIIFEDDVSNADKDADLVIYTPAIKANQMLTWYRDEGYEVLKRSEVLGLVTAAGHSYTVAGTHGKTTISTMLAHVLHSRTQRVNAFLGGISKNYNTNFLYSDQSDGSVVEADEFDMSFLKLHPDTIILTSLDADHLDIYGTAEEMKNSYNQFVKLLPASGLLISKYELNFSNPSDAEQQTYSLQNDYADIYALDIQMDKGAYLFDVSAFGEKYEGFRLNMGGMHNVENALSVIGLCLKIGMEIDDIRNALSSFEGVKRRFEYVYKSDAKVYIDDYAHHPEELRSLISSARALFGGRKVNIVFQPHLYSRTRDFSTEFADALDGADNIILMELYPARENPIEGVSSDLILSMMHNENKHLLSDEAVLEWVSAVKPELLITAGAGNIDRLVEPIKKIYESQ